MKNAREKLIIALDDLDFSSALRLVELTKPYASTFKVGLSLFTAHGPQIVNDIKRLGVEVFLDLKFHDIPMQVGQAVKSALMFEPRFLTIHASGGSKMMKEAQSKVLKTETTLLAVSVLTSLAEEDFRELNSFGSIEDHVLNLTSLAASSGIGGLVASPHEVKKLKHALGDRCMIICPGVRPAGSDANDQSRFMTPFDAIIAGADALVVGRPITKAFNIVEAARLINGEIEKALDMIQYRRSALSEASP